MCPSAYPVGCGYVHCNLLVSHSRMALTQASLLS